LAKGKEALPHNGGNNARTMEGKKLVEVIITHD
jgi:hypothetical protein